MSLTPAVDLWNVYRWSSATGVDDYSIFCGLYTVVMGEGVDTFLAVFDVSHINEGCWERPTTVLHARSVVEMEEKLREMFECGDCGSKPQELKPDGEGIFQSKRTHIDECFQKKSQKRNDEVQERIAEEKRRTKWQVDTREMGSHE